MPNEPLTLINESTGKEIEVLSDPSIPVVEPAELTDEQIDAVICDLLAHPDPDGPTKQCLAACRDIGCSGSGPEMYRRVRYPGKTTFEWPNAPRMPAPGSRAAERRVRIHCDLPFGTICQDFERNVFKGQRGKCSVSFWILWPNPVEGGKCLRKLPHRTLRSRPVWEVSLPNGTKFDAPRREV